MEGSTAAVPGGEADPAFQAVMALFAQAPLAGRVALLNGFLAACTPLEVRLVGSRLDVLVARDAAALAHTELLANNPVWLAALPGKEGIIGAAHQLLDYVPLITNGNFAASDAATSILAALYWHPEPSALLPGAPLAAAATFCRFCTATLTMALHHPTFTAQHRAVLQPLLNALLTAPPSPLRPAEAGPGAVVQGPHPNLLVSTTGKQRLLRTAPQQQRRHAAARPKEAAATEPSGACVAAVADAWGGEAPLPPGFAGAPLQPASSGTPDIDSADAVETGAAADPTPPPSSQTLPSAPGTAAVIVPMVSPGVKEMKRKDVIKAAAVADITEAEARGQCPVLSVVVRRDVVPVMKDGKKMGYGVLRPLDKKPRCRRGTAPSSVVAYAALPYTALQQCIALPDPSCPIKP